MTLDPDILPEEGPEPSRFDEQPVSAAPPVEPEPVPPPRKPSGAQTAVRRILGLILLTLVVLGGLLLFAYLSYYRPLTIERASLVDEVRQLNSDLSDTTASLDSSQQELRSLQATAEAGQEELSNTQINLALFRLQGDVLTARLGLATDDALSARTALRLADEDIQALRQLGADAEVVDNLEERLNAALTALADGDGEVAQDELRSLSEDIRTIDRPR